MIPSTKQSACSILPSYYSHLRSKILEFCMLKSTAFPIIHALSVASTNQNNYQDNVCIKYSEREYRAIASWHYLVYFDFWAKVYSEEGIYSVHLLKIWSEHGERRRWNSVFHQMPPPIVRQLTHFRAKLYLWMLMEKIMLHHIHFYYTWSAYKPIYV